MYYATGDFSQSQLTSYIASDTKYNSGTVAIGWVPKAMGKDIVAFETEMQQRDGDFHVYEVTGHGMPTFVRQGKDSFPIKAIISPNNGSMKAGFNLASIASRKRTMKKPLIRLLVFMMLV